jgi:hypothetical protein
MAASQAAEKVEKREELHPQGLKPDLFSTAYGAAGSRTLSKKAAVRSFSAACSAAEERTGSPS